jgi:ABC-2 type transport system permease protein
MRKLLAFVKRDYLVYVSYKFGILMQFARLFISVIVFYFLGKTFGSSLSPYIARYGTDYFSYVIIGLAGSSFVSVGLHSLASNIRGAQVEGTLEALLSTPSSIYTVLIGNSLWSFIQALGGAVVILAFGMYIQKMNLSAAGLGITAFILLLTLAAFLVVGVLSAAFIMIFKQGNPIGMIFGTSSYFLGGIIFPVDVLPQFLQSFSKILPITHALNALRAVLLSGAPLASVFPDIKNIALFIALFAPVSIVFFRYAVRRAKKDGSLIQY